MSDLDTPPASPDASSSRQSGNRVPRLPDALRLGHVRLQVRDLAQSMRYYGSVLGLNPRNASGDTAALYAGEDPAPLVELVERHDTAPVRVNSRLGLYHFALLLPDRAALGRFLSHLAANNVPFGSSDHLVSEAIYLRDPDGLGIEVYADRPRSEWRHSGGQLVMATEPLDSGAVIAAARGARWSGMPTGTVMGHVHLHVGDIDAASRFYHDALGLDRMVWSYPGALFLSAGGYHHHLGLNTWAGNVPTASPREARLLEWRMRFPSPADARAAAERLTATGHEARQSEDGWLVADPWGTTLRLTTT